MVSGRVRAGGKSYSGRCAAPGGEGGGEGAGLALSVSARAAAAMGNQHSAAHATHRPRKNVHWKSAGRPGPPGKPEIIPVPSEEEANAITLRWTPAAHDGGAPLQGYQVECNRLGSAEWVRTAPPLVLRPELLLTGLEPPHRYQFRVAALNAVGRSDYGELSDVLTVGADPLTHRPPTFLNPLPTHVTALENDNTEFRVSFTGSPAPTVAWFKDDYEIFSSRRTAITTTESDSVLVFHQTLASDEGEIKCTATNRAGHAVTRSRLELEAAPKLRYPRQYEDGLLYEINETIFLKTTIVGKPTPTVEWRHDGKPVLKDGRVEITTTAKHSMLKIQAARRSDRGEYQVHASNSIGEDTAAFLVTVTAPPDPPRRVTVARQIDRSVTLAWEPPDDDGGCRIGNYVVEYYRAGWDVWLKATTSRKTQATLFDLIEGSEYRFRVKAESPYGMSAPSEPSASIRTSGRAADAEALAVESRIITGVLQREDGEAPAVSPAPRRRRVPAPAPAPPPAPPPPIHNMHHAEHNGSNEFMLVLYPDNKMTEKAEKRKSFQLELEDSLSPPPLSLSAPELSAAVQPPPLRHAASSTELLHERAMQRFYRAVELEQEHARRQLYIPDKKPANDRRDRSRSLSPAVHINAPQIYIKSDSVEERRYSPEPTPPAVPSPALSPTPNRWQQLSFDEDYTASTVSSEGEYSDEDSIDGQADRSLQSPTEEDTYNPRDKITLSSPVSDGIEEEEEEREVIKPLPLPDPNFVPKPILKRREPEIPEIKLTSRDNGTVRNEEKQKNTENPVKEEKINMFKKFTKMPVQKPFPFPKILKKKEVKKAKEPNKNGDTPVVKPTKKVEKVEDKITEEGRTVIDYYGSIVKEYGSQKKSSTPMYLNTEDLKTVAEKQQHEKKDKETRIKKLVKLKKTAQNKADANKQTPTKSKAHNSVEKPTKPKQSKFDRTKLDKNDKSAAQKPQQADAPTKKCTQQIVLKTTERATIVIPIDYEELEQKAKVRVRSAIDYVVDLCLLAVAFWVYLFKDERLAIPLLSLIIYRQVRDSLQALPARLRALTPRWMKRKPS